MTMAQTGADVANVVSQAVTDAMTTITDGVAQGVTTAQTVIGEFFSKFLFYFPACVS